nr:MAG TPA: hypothetical protein [Caudoviricetes sp.]
MSTYSFFRMDDTLSFVLCLSPTVHAHEHLILYQFCMNIKL